MDRDEVPDTPTGHWHASLGPSWAAFAALPPPQADRAGRPALWQPRVCPGVGIGIPLARLPSLALSITTVLRTPTYRASTPTRARHDPWSTPGIDLTEHVAYLRGPVLLPAHDDTPGYRLCDHFHVAFPDLAALHTRLRTAMTIPTVKLTTDPGDPRLRR